MKPLCWTYLATLLFEAVPESCRIILLGDANQLASVDVGAYLQIYSKSRLCLKTVFTFKPAVVLRKGFDWSSCPIYSNANRSN
jgi:hypothetical protein